ncbi:DUF7577 domain-containing protein [Halobaculum sp. EA56]|uniref:DUF7577 domain-containing protein n=1 Tax=Halobaculum sp. EA56 TaxID=3421648 RepID=UPI003EC025F5
MEQVTLLAVIAGLFAVQVALVVYGALRRGDRGDLGDRVAGVDPTPGEAFPSREEGPAREGPPAGDAPAGRVRCRACGTANDDAYRFCRACVTPLPRTGGGPTGSVVGERSTR